jgi:hypothetical protein
MVFLQPEEWWNSLYCEAHDEPVSSLFEHYEGVGGSLDVAFLL